MSKVKLIFISLFLYTGYAMACSCGFLDPNRVVVSRFPRFDIALDIILIVISFTLWHLALFIFRKFWFELNRFVFSLLGFISLIPAASLSYKLQTFDPFGCGFCRGIFQFGPNYLHLALSILFILLLDRLIYVCFLKRQDENS